MTRIVLQTDLLNAKRRLNTEKRRATVLRQAGQAVVFPQAGENRNGRIATFIVWWDDQS